MSPLSPRPTLLIVEPEPTQALSVRKLLMETAKFNVLTAHSTREALELANQFPKVSAVVLVGGEGVDCDRVAATFKSGIGDAPVIFLAASIGARCAKADHQISSHEPQELLDLVRSILGDPRQMDA